MGRPKSKRNIKGPQRIKKKLKRVKRPVPALDPCLTCKTLDCIRCKVALDSA